MSNELNPEEKQQSPPDKAEQINTGSSANAVQEPIETENETATPTDPVESETYLPATNNALANHDPGLLKVFAFRLEIDKEGNMITISNLKNIAKRAARLILLLKKEYDLKN